MINFVTAVVMFAGGLVALSNGNYHAVAASLTAVILAVGFGCEQLKNK